MAALRPSRYPRPNVALARVLHDWVSLSFHVLISCVHGILAGGYLSAHIPPNGLRSTSHCFVSRAMCSAGAVLARLIYVRLGPCARSVRYMQTLVFFVSCSTSDPLLFSRSTRSTVSCSPFL